MENDDAQIGRLLTRREVLALLGLTGAATMLGCRSKDAIEHDGATTSGTTGTTGAIAADTANPAIGRAVPACVVRPEQTEGPYFVDEPLDRSDIRSDPSDGAVSKGVALAIAFAVSRIAGGRCTPLAGARVDVWHCDALGVYSDVRDFQLDTRGKKFLRGHQLTDASGAARFTTIYPGWYRGRAVHIHFKIRTDPESQRGHEFTSQLYFDDALTDRVHTQAPYASKGQRDLKNGGDGIFQEGGDQLLLAPVEHAGRYAATFEIGLDLG